MFLSLIKGVLGPPQLQKIRTIVGQSRFVSGHVSGGSHSDKQNLELAADTEQYADAVAVVESAVRDNKEFNYTAFPRFMTRPIISRYVTGMYYKEHVDFPLMGFMTPLTRRLSPLGANYVRSDLSMTLFLTPPDSYGGGELCFDSPTGPVRIKLEAGSAVLYPTGARHSVATVTQGERLAAVFWIQTLFPVESHRRAVHDAYRLMSMLNGDGDQPTHVLAQDNFNNLFRLLAEV
jgi:PKHD-type hydroxylase